MAKPIRNYNDGQWLLLLWAFVVLFLAAGFAISTTVLVVAILGALAAGYTTFLYVAEQTGRPTTITLFGRQIGPDRARAGVEPDGNREGPDYQGPDYQGPGHQGTEFPGPGYQSSEQGETRNVEGGQR